MALKAKDTEGIDFQKLKRTLSSIYNGQVDMFVENVVVINQETFSPTRIYIL